MRQKKKKKKITDVWGREGSENRERESELKSKR